MVVCGLTLAAGEGLAAPSGVHMQSEAAPLMVQVLAVRATREGPVDPRLRSMEREMKSRGFEGFSLERAERKPVSAGKGRRFELSPGYTTEIRQVRRSASTATLRIVVRRDGALQHKADVTLPRNQGYITVVKPEGARPALVMAITPVF